MRGTILGFSLIAVGSIGVIAYVHRAQTLEREEMRKSVRKEIEEEKRKREHESK